MRKKKFFQPVTLIVLVRITVPVTDKKCPTSRDLGMVSLVNSGHTGRPAHLYGKNTQKIATTLKHSSLWQPF